MTEITAKAPNKSSGLLGKILVLIAVLVVGFFALGFLLTRSEAKARDMCEEAVKQQLPSPAKVSFAKETVTRTDASFEIKSGVYYSVPNGDQKYAKYGCTFAMTDPPSLILFCVGAKCN